MGESKLSLDPYLTIIDKVSGWVAVLVLLLVFKDIRKLIIPVREVLTTSKATEEKIDKLIDKGTGATISKGSVKTLKLALEEPTVKQFLIKYHSLIPILWRLVAGHFKGNSIEFIKFLLNSAAEYDTSKIAAPVEYSEEVSTEELMLTEKELNDTPSEAEKKEEASEPEKPHIVYRWFPWIFR